MGVRKQGRRKLRVGGRLYVWYVKPDADSPDNVLHVISDDKQFLVHYHLNQRTVARHIIVLGRDFERTPGNGGTWRRFRCPEWTSQDGVITPATVRKLIEWCCSSEPIMEVDFSGQAVPLGGCCSACGVDLRGMVPVLSNCCHKCGRVISERVAN
jgi:hypothetical protein